MQSAHWPNFLNARFKWWRKFKGRSQSSTRNRGIRRLTFRLHSCSKLLTCVVEANWLESNWRASCQLMADPKLPSPRNQLSSVTMTLMQLCGGWTLMEMKRSHFQTISQLCCHTSSMVTSRKVQLWIKWSVRRWKLGWNPRLTKLKNSISSRLGPPRQVLLVAGNHPMASRTFGRKIARFYRIAI